MKIHPIIAGAIFGAMLGIQAWTLTEIVALKVAVAALTWKLDGKQLSYPPTYQPGKNSSQYPANKTENLVNNRQ